VYAVYCFVPHVNAIYLKCLYVCLSVRNSVRLYQTTKWWYDDTRVEERIYKWRFNGFHNLFTWDRPREWFHF